MAKRDIESELQAVAALRLEPATSRTLDLLRRALGDRVNVMVAKAAEVTAALQARVLMPDLLAAYHRLFESPEKRDAQCWGKNALAKALKDLEWSESEPFVKGARHYQWEPVWNGEADCAATLRAICLLALPFCLDILRDQKLWHLMRGLSDGAAAVRLEAARALEQIGGCEAALLLRLKARMPESDPAVSGQMFESLLAVEGASAVPFVMESVLQRGENEKDETLAEAAALALGASRMPAAVDALLAGRNEHPVGGDDILFRALGVSRTEPAIEFLLQMIRHGREREAAAALSALSLHRDSPEIVRRVSMVVEECDSAAVSTLFARYFEQ